MSAIKDDLGVPPAIKTPPIKTLAINYAYVRTYHHGELDNPYVSVS